MTATLHGHLAVVGALLLLASGAAHAQPIEKLRQPQSTIDSAAVEALAAKIDDHFAQHCSTRIRMEN